MLESNSTCSMGLREETISITSSIHCLIVFRAFSRSLSPCAVVWLRLCDINRWAAVQTEKFTTVFTRILNCRLRETTTDSGYCKMCCEIFFVEFQFLSILQQGKFTTLHLYVPWYIFKIIFIFPNRWNILKFFCWQ